MLRTDRSGFATVKPLRRAGRSEWLGIRIDRPGGLPCVGEQGDGIAVRPGSDPGLILEPVEGDIEGRGPTRAARRTEVSDQRGPGSIAADSRRASPSDRPV